MNAQFADSYYYLAMLNRDDEGHERAIATSRELHVSTVTTAWVLTEVADAMARPGERAVFVSLIERLQSNPNVRIVPATPELFAAGLDLYRRRPDKEWPLSDCISFVVMKREGLTEALTADHHFEQAGFKAVLKE
jgi:uncharacterized protein